MSKIKLANELKRLLPGQDNSRIRQAIMEAYQRATGAPSLNPVYYQSSITNIVQQIVTEGSAAENGLIKLDKTRLGGEIIQDTELYILEGRDYNLITSSVTGVGAMGGKYYLACQVDGAYTVVRINSDFTLDHQYGIFNNVVNDIAVNADGTMFATGKFTTYNDVSYNRAVKLHPDGTVDATFNIGTGFNAGAAPFTNVQNARVTILDDNSVIFCGQFTSYNGVTRGGIIRLNQDGTLFSTWNDGVGIAGASRIIWNGRKQADGKIVVTGLFTSYNGLSLPSAPVDGYNALFRINSDGTLDTGFAPQMFYGIDFIPIEIRPDGKILVAGSLGQIVQYNPDGTMDQGFNGGNNFTGTITDPSSGQVLNLELLSNGDVLASGNMTLMDDTVKNLIKIDPSGSIVSDFDTKFNGTVLDTITDEAANLIIAFTGKNSNPSISTTYFTEYDGVPINDFAELTLDTAVLFTEKKGVDLVYEKGLIKYKGKYHQYYDNRTLPDKEYVDEKISQVSSEGSPAVDNLLSTSATLTLSANQGRILKGFIDTINGVLSSDDTTLDELQEIVNYIKQNKTELDTMGIPNIAGLVDALAAKVDILSIIDNLTSTLANAPLSANQGRVLKNLIDALSGTVDGKVNTADIVDALNSVAVNLPLSANQGRELKALIDAINLTLASNDPALNTLQEVVTLLKTHETTLGNLGVADVSGLQGVLDLKVNIAAIVDNLTSTLVDAPLSANQGRILKGFIDNINTLLASDDTTLDELQEIVNFIKQNKSELETLGIPNIAGLVDALAAKVDILSIIDNLTSTLANAPLSANQGRVLKGLIDALSGTLSGKVNTADIVDALNSVAVNLPLSANQGRELKALIDAINLTLASNDPALNTLQEVVTLLKSHETTLGNLGVADVSGLQGVLDLKVNIAAIVDNLTSTLVDAPLSANQGRILKGFIDNINTLLASDDTTLDELQEIVNFIKQNKSELDTLGIPNIAGLVDALAAKVDILSIIDNLTSTLVNAPLSANQGRVLKGLIDTLSGTISGKVNTADIVDALNSVAVNMPLSANQGRELKALIDAINLTLASNDPALNTLQEVVTLLKSHETTLGNLGVADVSGLQAALDLKVDLAAIVDNLTSTLADAPLSANQGRILKGFIDNINILLASDDTTLDELQELVNFIKANRSDLDALSISNIAGLVDALAGKVAKAGDTMTGHLTVQIGTEYARLTEAGLVFNRVASYLRPTIPFEKNLYIGGSAKDELDWVNIKFFNTGDFLLNNVPITSGTGPANYLAKFDATGKIIGDSQIFDNGTNVGISNPLPTYKLDIVADVNFLNIVRNGIAATQGFFRITNYTSSPVVFAPIFHGRSNEVTYPGTTFLGDVTTDTGEAPIVRIQGRQNNTTVGNRPILAVENGPTGINLFRVHADGRIQMHFVDNAVGDILHISASGVVTKRTLAELKSDLNITVDTSNLVELVGPPQYIQSQITHKYNLKTEGAYMLEANAVIYNGAGYASINYLNSFRWYFSRHDADIHAVIDLVDLTQNVVLKWPTSGGTIATLEGQPFDDSGSYIAITKSIQESSDPDSKLITDAEAQTKIDDQIPDSNEYQMGLDAISGAAIIRTHNLPASGTPNWKSSGIYGSPDSPLSGSLATVDLVQARNTTITIYHKAAVEPAWPDYTYKKGEAYSTTDLNIIHFRYHASTLLVAYIETIPYTSVDITSGLLFNFFHHDSDHVWDGVAATGSMEDHAGLGDAAVHNPDTLSWVSGQVNRACYLGTTLNFTPYSYLKIPTTAARAALTNVFTWASWITYPEVNAASSDFLVTDGIGQRGIYIQSANSNDRIECILDRNFVTPDSSTTRLRLNGVFVPGVPVHIAFRYSGTRIYGYVNGAWAGTTGADYVSPGLGNSSDYMINSSPQETGGWGSFIMERTRLYNRGLTDAEISALANETI